MWCLDFSWTLKYCLLFQACIQCKLTDDQFRWLLFGIFSVLLCRGQYRMNEMAVSQNVTFKQEQVESHV
jgi:hypothetical protein